MTADLKEQLQRTLGDSYTIERELGGGGMSRVFVATERALGRRVVLKVLPPETAAQVSIERFKREISVAAQLQQAHIVPLLSAGDSTGLPYYTMPLVDGESLRARLMRERELPIGEAIGILREVARALAYAHQRGVVHRDIKPDNVLLSGGSAMVTDFGVAKALSASTDGGESSITSLGVALGTPAYMSPEQATADPLIDHRADIYAFGAMAYELLSGEPPFAGRPPQATLAAQVSETPESIERRRPAVPPTLAQLVMRCLAKRPADRPQSAGEILLALDAIQTPGTGMLPTSAIGNRSSSEGRRWKVAATLLVVASLGVGAFAAWRGRSPGPGAVKTVAVLPFTNLSGSKEDEPFTEGMTLEITDALGKLPGLSVTAPSLAKTVRADSIDIRRVAELLNVGSLLQGSVQHVGTRVRINVQLVSVPSGVQEWSGKFDAEFKDVFAVQDTIARAVVGALQVRLASAGGQLVRAATTSPEAHTLYLQGLYEWNRRTTQNLQQAITLFEQALAKDENYAQARAGVAMAYAVMPTFSDVNNEAIWAHSMEVARKALAIDSTSAEAHSALGFSLMGMYRYASAEREFRTAIRNDSSFATAHQWLGQVLGLTGRFDEAIAAGRRARELDPESRVIRTTLFLSYFRARKLDSAEAVLKELQQLYPTYPNTYRSLTQLYHGQRRAREELESAERGLQLVGERLSYPLGQLGLAYVSNGDTARARAILKELVDRSQRAPVNAIAVSLLCDALGARDEALTWLERSVGQHDPWYNVGRTPLLDHLRTDPRAAALLAKVESPNNQ
jgi:eukaryotic-like serine/threonine-protein kinase